jgi:DNA invertase Pin-like site-specific DNA recombinase
MTPGLRGLMAYIREDDTVVVRKLDRLGRNTPHIVETVKALTDRGVTLVSVVDGIDSSTAAGSDQIPITRCSKRNWLGRTAPQYRAARTP